MLNTRRRKILDAGQVHHTKFNKMKKKFARSILLHLIAHNKVPSPTMKSITTTGILLILEILLLFILSCISVDKIQQI